MNNKLNFYDAFSCTADKCPITCCQEWKIAVDDETKEKWDNAGIRAQLQEEDDTTVTKLNKEKRCPFLNDKNLCNLVIREGDSFLSKTCALFPRQIQTYPFGKEYTLTACCPAVVDLLKEEAEIFLVPTNNIEKTDSPEKTDNLLIAVREMAATIMRNEAFSIQESLLLIFYALLELDEEEELTEEVITYYQKEKNVRSILASIHRMQFNRLYTFDERNELFLDLAENYRKKKLYTKSLESIALLAERCSDGYDEEKLKKKLDTFDAQMKHYDKLFRNYLTAEIYGSLLTPEGDIKTMIAAMEWIGMEYVSMLHSIFLYQQLGENNACATYEDIRKYMVIISRMTGYDEEDIWEYLEDSFESLIWDWGYFALIIGI